MEGPQSLPSLMVTSTSLHLQSFFWRPWEGKQGDREKEGGGFNSSNFSPAVISSRLTLDLMSVENSDGDDEVEDSDRDEGMEDMLDMITSMEQRVGEFEDRDNNLSNFSPAVISSRLTLDVRSLENSDGDDEVEDSDRDEGVEDMLDMITSMEQRVEEFEYRDNKPDATGRRSRSWPGKTLGAEEGRLDSSDELISYFSPTVFGRRTLDVMSVEDSDGEVEGMLEMITSYEQRVGEQVGNFGDRVSKLDECWMEGEMLPMFADVTAVSIVSGGIDSEDEFLSSEDNSREFEVPLLETLDRDDGDETSVAVVEAPLSAPVHPSSHSPFSLQSLSPSSLNIRTNQLSLLLPDTTVERLNQHEDNAADVQGVKRKFMAELGLQSIEDSETDEKEREKLSRKNLKEHRSLRSEVKRWNIYFTEEARRMYARSLLKNKLANKQIEQRIEFDKEVQEQQEESDMQIAPAMPSRQQRMKMPNKRYSSKEYDLG